MEVSLFNPRKMSSRVGGVKSKHPDNFRKKVAEEYLTGSMTLAELGKLYDLPLGTVSSFVRWYKKRFDLSALQPNSEVFPDLDPSSKTADLERMLHFAKLKIEALETMIDIAEQEFKLDIRKKSGAKPSKK